jgi:hypothetical protein
LVDLANLRGTRICMHGWGCPNHVKLSNLPLYDSCCFLIYEVCLLYIKKKGQMCPWLTLKLITPLFI